MKHGRINTQNGIGGSITAIFSDFADIWKTAIEGYLEIPATDFQVTITETDFITCYGIVTVIIQIILIQSKIMTYFDKCYLEILIYMELIRSI